MSVRIQMRRGTTSEWNSADPILNEGEIGYNSTLSSFKIGDGTSLWSALDYYQAAADITPSEIGAIASTEKDAANGVAALDATKNVITALSVVFEGATANDFETLLTATEPASDITLSLPNATDTLVGRATTDTLSNKSISGSANTLSNIGNASLTNSAITINGTSVSLGGSITVAGDIESVSAGTGLTGGGTSGAVTLSVDTAVVATTSNTLTMSNKTLTSPTVTGLFLNDSSIVFEGSSADAHETTLTVVNPTTDRTITLPDNSGTVVTTGDTGTVTSTMIADGTIVNADINASAAIALSKLASGTSGQIIVANSSGVPAWVSESGDVTISDTGVTAISSGVIVDADVNASAAIAQSKISGLTTDLAAKAPLASPTFTGTVTLPTGTVTSGMILDGTIVNADINASAAIDKTKISGTAITAGDTGTVTSTMIADGTIVNADINASAAIAVSKLAASTISGVTLGNNLNALTIGTGLSGTSYNGSSAVTVAIDSTVATTSGTQTLTNKTVELGNNTVSGNIAQFNTALTDGDFATLAGSETLTNKTLGSSTTLGANLNANSNKITSLGTPTASTDAATKQYVDDLSQGLHIHDSVVAATTANLNATYANGSSGVTATLTNAGTLAAFSVDGVSPALNARILVKNQSTTFQNGIYTLTVVGTASVAWVLTRATDFDTPTEIDGGDFVFVTGGTVGDNTGWVQTETVSTVGTSAILFTQFSGAGTYLAGNGLTLTGNTFTINTSITADLSTAQTLTNKTISLGNNTVSGNIAQFNTALSDADFATLAGSETFTNKTLTSPTVTGLFLNDSSIVFEGSSADAHETTLTVVNPTADRTITLPNATGTIALQGFIPASLTWGDLKNGKSA